MSGTANGRRGRTDQESYRDLERRVRALEQMGPWRLNDRDGEAWLSAPGRTSINLSALAVTSDAVVAQSGLWRRTITVIGGPGGTFILVYNEMPTANIAVNASAATVATRIKDLSTELNDTNVLVSGPSGGPWTLIAPSGSLQADWAGLTGGTDPWVQIT